jgi:tetratricopeptide (TPR) repeat protein
MLALPLFAILSLAMPGDQTPADTVPLYTNLGTHAYRVSTSVPAAQTYFNQGLRLYYAFNHAEAIRSFREAQRLDSTCAMCFWGEAIAWGPNINAPMDSAAGVAAYAAIQRAIGAKRHATATERALIDALAQRYRAVPPADRAVLDSAYARAMATAARRHAGDHEVAVLMAESQMDLRPWNYWTPEGALQPGMAEAVQHLERVMAANPRHPGACHFYIHAVEAEHPERAVPCAERLAGLMPGAGHLVHMPGHIYIRVGRYLDAIRANEHAVHADESYIRDQRPGAGVYTAAYYPHNYDFLAFAAIMAGRSSQALHAADTLATLLPAGLLGAPGLEFLQQDLIRGLQVRVRFGRWSEILTIPAPADSLLYARAIRHYARGRAFAATGQLDSADAELEHLRALAGDPRLIGTRLQFNEAPVVLEIATQVLAGTIASGRGSHDDAVAALRTAARLEDALTYGEPPEWTVPVRQDLGAVLLRAGNAREAEAAYREDLEHFPLNGWSLAGVARALRAQQRGDEALRVEEQLHQAWASADVKPPVD